MRRVAITGLGVISPVGLDVETSFSAVVNGASGIDVIPEWRDGVFAGEKMPVIIGGQVKGFNAEDWIEPKKDIRRMDRLIQFVMAAGKQAWTQAGFPQTLEGSPSERAGTVIGVGLLGVETFLSTYDVLKQKGPRRVSPFFIPATVSNLAPGHLAIKHGLRGPCFSVVSACASGAHAIGEAFLKIKDGYADIMVAGGAECPMVPLAASGFSAMHALCATKNHAPTKASRPYDRDRDGFVMAEGAGVVVLEEWENAKRRGANILAELVGYGCTDDAFHITAPPENAEGATRAMTQAMQMGMVDPTKVAYINGHGTSTEFNDRAETTAIKAAFGEHAYKLAVSSTKSVTGHMIGAAGAVEAIFSVLAIMRSIMPPTINYETPDPLCDLDYIPNIAREKSFQYAMSNSFGFGGTNAVLLLKKA